MIDLSTWRGVRTGRKYAGKRGDSVRRNGRGEVKIDVIAAIKADADGTLSDRDRQTIERIIPGILASAQARAAKAAERRVSEAGRKAAE